MATPSHCNMIKQCNETSYTRTVVWTIISSLLSNSLQHFTHTHKTPKTAANVMTAIFNSKHDTTSNHTATYHVPLHTTDYYGKYLIYRGSEHNGVLFVCTNKCTHTHTYILKYITNAPICFRALLHLQGALILRLLKLIKY